MSDLEGVMLSDYLLLQCISRGGTADVYHARQTGEGNHEVAVKVFHPDYAQRAPFRDQFMAEAEKTGQFDHPNILPYLEFGEGEGLLYAVTPFMASGTLEDLLARVGGKLSAMQALPLMQQLCSAVQYAHNHDVIHGNIKPTNVFVALDGRMLLADFGIARRYDDDQQSLASAGWGPTEYAAPEQSLGVLRPASDIYALGVLLFRVLTGTLPFTGQTPVEVLLKHVRQQTPSARSLVPTISDVVDGVLSMAMQKRSADCFTSAEEFSNAFLVAVTFAPVASPAAKSVVTQVLQPIDDQLVPVGNLHMPVASTPALSGVLADQYFHSPAPMPSVLSSPALNPGNLPVPIPVNANRPAPPILFFGDSATDAGTEGKDAQPVTFSSEQMSIGKHRFWSVDSDPIEWSPITNTPVDQVPMTVNAYLNTHPTTPIEAPLLSEPVSPARIEESSDQKHHSFSRLFNKVLPIVVVILLLLGLLGALLSSFYFPSDDHGGYVRPTHVIVDNLGREHDGRACRCFSR